jgi:YidC/Oxa1 family membrane protein insertase
VDENKNLLIAVTLSILIFIGWQYFFVPEQPLPQEYQHRTLATTHASNPQPTGLILPSAGQSKQTEEVLSVSSPRLSIDAPELKGSFALRGMRLDDLELKNFRQDVDSKSASIRLLSNGTEKRPFFITFEWVAQDDTTSLPDNAALWTASASVLKPDAPVTLTWNNEQGVTFERILSVDKHFLLTIKQRILNNSAKPITVTPLAAIEGVPETDIKGQWTFHEGAVGFIHSALEEKSFEKMQHEGSVAFPSENGGWAGITEKYWLVAFLAESGKAQTIRYQYIPETQHYRVDAHGNAMTVAPGETIESVYHFYIGAKNVQLLDKYEDQLGIKHFDLAIDFGYFYFLTRPLFYALVYMKDFFGGNMGVCIILLTILIKLLLFPLANRSYRAMSRMRKLQPKVQTIQKNYENDKQRLSQELMALYKREKVNPVGGCLPQLVQFPVLFALYKVFLVSIEMRHAAMWWIRDLSAPDPLLITNLFGLIPWTPFEFLQVGIWPIFMGATMFVQQKMSPPPADPAQAKVFLFMPIMFTVMMARLPAGLVMYWTWSNILSIFQQWVVTRLDERHQVKTSRR